MRYFRLSEAFTGPLPVTGPGQAFAPTFYGYPVNTVIYLSLFDAARPPGATSPLVSSSDILYWLTILLNVMHRAPMDSVVLRQLCWTMCSLAWALSPPVNGVTVRTLVPRPHSQHGVARAMAELLSCEQDPDVLSTAVVALECILWNIGPDAKDDHAQLCAALQERYTHFLSYHSDIKGPFVIPSGGSHLRTRGECADPPKDPSIIISGLDGIPLPHF